ncbi:hypothetical protein [Roseimicrobium sp. ORNL1]|uniref:hypothetical protein n=1 Tax=Roseimicrobium sp. ORNL1 TaxID=2711231 RepID=UPI0013E1A727|nr:hypothetical protein [Roseimicrobium sp. ORNL1]QIF01933.1 hypothetical protein G5S37_10460 [Roseimicrobium sp. ORNL1]
MKKKKEAVKSTRRVAKVTARSAVVKGKAAVEDGEEVALVSVVPCPFPTDPAKGDKTPEVMAWYREYQPEEFKRRYGNRVCPEVDEGVMMVGRCGVRGAVGEDGGPVSDFEDEDDEVVVVKPRVIMG